MGQDDRALRAFIAFIIGFLFIFYIIHSWWGNVIYYIGLYALITSYLGFDPFYFWKKITTKYPDDGFR